MSDKYCKSFLDVHAWRLDIYLSTSLSPNGMPLGREWFRWGAVSPQHHRPIPSCSYNFPLNTSTLELFLDNNQMRRSKRDNTTISNSHQVHRRGRCDQKCWKLNVELKIAAYRHRLTIRRDSLLIFVEKIDSLIGVRNPTEWPIQQRQAGFNGGRKRSQYLEVIDMIQLKNHNRRLVEVRYGQIFFAPVQVFICSNCSQFEYYQKRACWKIGR